MNIKLAQVLDRTRGHTVALYQGMALAVPIAGNVGDGL
jgi:hypothetical protein